MAGDRFYQPRLSPASAHLKPYHLSTISVSSDASNGVYQPVPFESYQDEELRQYQLRDSKVKSRIRILRVVSRGLATICSAATLAPLLMTLVKYLQTRDVYFQVDGVQRTAWANDTIAWYTYMYTAVAAISFLLNLAIMLAYLRGIKHANKVDSISTKWTWLVMIVHIVAWAVSTGIYRYGKEPVDGKFKDLWGWTCSTSADELQSFVTTVDFSKYCTIQSSSFYAGLVNVAVGLLSIIIMIMTILRKRSKKQVKRATFRLGSGAYGGSDLEPLRS